MEDKKFENLSDFEVLDLSRKSGFQIPKDSKLIEKNEYGCYILMSIEKFNLQKVKVMQEYLVDMADDPRISDHELIKWYRINLKRMDCILNELPGEFSDLAPRLATSASLSPRGRGTEGEGAPELAVDSDLNDKVRNPLIVSNHLFIQVY